MADCLIENNDNAMIKLRSEDTFVVLGLDDLSDPVTKALLNKPNQEFFSPEIKDEIANVTDPDDRLFFSRRDSLATSLQSGWRLGDLICVLLGCFAPVALPRVETHYEFIRSVYVDEIMFGEAMKALERGEVELQDFELH
jgi:hypothetical protein